MHAVEFETEIVNDTICIPQEYKDCLPQKVRVIIMDELSSRHPDIIRTKKTHAATPGDFNMDELSSHRCRIVRTKKKYTVTPDDFNSVVIDTTKFKFNREEANERR